MAGAADPMMLFPAATTFTPYSILRNVSNAPISVTPTLWWMQGAVAANCTGHDSAASNPKFGCVGISRPSGPELGDEDLQWRVQYNPRRQYTLRRSNSRSRKR
jgi:hypothetical protein